MRASARAPLSASSRATATPPRGDGSPKASGGGIRGPDEHCTVWLLDPRFPLPKSMARAIGGPGQGQAMRYLELIHCIPARFRHGRAPAIDHGEVWPF